MRREYIADFDIPKSGKIHGQSVMPKQELIRCEDCVWRDKKSANCERFRKGWYVQALSYCSWAERKEESRKEL